MGSSKQANDASRGAFFHAQHIVLLRERDRERDERSWSRDKPRRKI